MRVINCFYDYDYKQICFRAAVATRESGLTPVVTHSGDVTRLEPTTSMVLRSQVRGGRSSAAIPDVEVRQEIEFRQEPKIENPAEI